MINEYVDTLSKYERGFITSPQLLAFIIVGNIKIVKKVIIM